MTTASQSQNPPSLHNRTRRTPDLEAKFRRAGRIDLVLLHRLLRRSDLAREGIEHSGSFRFADHVYANHASGEGWVGRCLDRILLNLPATVVMRDRCARSTLEMRRAFDRHVATGDRRAFRMLTVPCGIPRDVRDFLRSLPPGHPPIEFTGIDLDPSALEEARRHLQGVENASICFVEADALAPGSCAAACPDPAGWDFVASTGLGEFLDDRRCALFYANVHAALRPGGVFFTSALAPDRRSEWLPKTFELEAHYRTAHELQRLAATCQWRTTAVAHHRSGLGTYILLTR
jgi:SAM-dependent methyltransferase